jgi:hypothetical protein
MHNRFPTGDFHIPVGHGRACQANIRPPQSLASRHHILHQRLKTDLTLGRVNANAFGGKVSHLFHELENTLISR